VTDATTQSEPISLEQFLAELEPDLAEQARVAAIRMDELERSINDQRDIERRYWWVAAIAAVFFVFGAVLVLVPGEMTKPIYEVVGPFLTTLMICGLGIVGLVYAYLVRDRSNVDEEKFALNREHFVPHNAYYFPPEAPGEAGRVVRFTPRKMKPVMMGPHDRVQPGRSWW
jgi:hypothetical protein